MSSDNRQEVIFLQNLLYGLQSELIAAFALEILGETARPRLLVGAGIRPKQIAEEALQWWLDEPVYLINIFDIC